MKNSLNFFKTNLALVASFLFAIVYFALISCQPQPPKNSRLAQAERGKVHFQQYCVQCHGIDAKGIKIDSLDVQPSDLTQIVSSRKSTEFPIMQIARIIDGRNMVKAHGPRDMPVWGEVFSQEELLDESQIKGKMGELIAYLIGIQK